MDYREIGLKVGLEVHQQLLTERKLFCRCPAGRYTDSHDGTVLRHMRPTLSELGEYDGTALMEFKTKKNIIYLLHKSNVCTYEMDDTPPFLVNQQAIDIAIEQCLSLGCDLVDEVHIARKQYLDGSIPTGFQRTAIVGVNGSIPFAGRELGIIQISVEEDSCREVSDHGHLIVWRADRLGMPLIETVTEPTLRHPDEVEEAILLIGRICRATGHVRVGQGASRQDVNVSVRGGTRVEIKGVPSARWAPRLVRGEALRQVQLLKLRDELHRRGLRQDDDVRIGHQDITSLVENSSLHMLHRDEWQHHVEIGELRRHWELGQGDYCVRAIKIEGLAGTLSWPTQPDATFVNELAGRVRVIAGLDQQPILLSSEKWPEFQGSLKLLKAIRRRLRAGSEDAVVLVWGPSEDTLCAVNEIRARFVEALRGVPAETRQPFADGSTDFERILPGPDRMYPDTDSPPTRLVHQRIQKLAEALPEPLWQREQRYREAKVPERVIRYLMRRGGARRVDLVVQKTGCDLHQACFFFAERVRGLARAGVAVDRIPDERWVQLFALFAQKPVLREAWARVVRLMASTPEIEVSTICLQDGLGAPVADWKAFLPAMRDEAKRACSRAGDHRSLARFELGQVMRTLRGRVPVATVRSALGSTMEVSP